MQILAQGPHGGPPTTAPTSLSAIPTNTNVAISFTAPSNDGGLTITNYEYSFNNSSWTALSPADAVSPVTVSGLTQNTAYTVYLRAVNVAGSGPGSTGVSFTTAGVPTGTPTISSVTPTTTTATIYFSYPGGGGAATGYEYYMQNGTNAWTYGGTGSPIVVSGLTPNTTYYAYVRATNAYGVGPQSAASGFVTPPTFISATGGSIVDYASGGYTYRSHTFASNGTFTVSTVGSFGTVDIHVVGGGGGGGWSYGGGGGGGGARTESGIGIAATSYGITVGGGGAIGVLYTYTGSNGGSSEGLSRSVLGGGGGSSNVTGAGSGGSGGGGNLNQIPGGAGSAYGSAGGGVNGGGGNGGSGYNQPNAFRTGSNETYALGGYGSVANGYGAPAGGTTYGCGGGGGGNYNQVNYYGGASVGGCVIIRYRIA